MARIADALERIAAVLEARDNRLVADRARYTSDVQVRMARSRRTVEALERTAAATEKRNELIEASEIARDRMFKADMATRERQFETIQSLSAMGVDERPLADVAIAKGWHIEGSACPLYQPHDHLPNDAVRFESDQTPALVASVVERMDAAKPRGFWHPKGPGCEGEFNHEHSGDGIFWTAGPRQGETTGKTRTLFEPYDPTAPRTAFQRLIREAATAPVVPWTDTLLQTVDERAANALKYALDLSPGRSTVETIGDFRRELRLSGLDIVAYTEAKTASEIR